MIIILKEADFSANNVGKIVIPKNYDELTKRIFYKCRRFPLGSAQSDVVDNFVKVLKTNGLHEHLSVLVFPWLSSTNEEAFYNFADNTTFDFGSNFVTNNGRTNPTTEGKYVSLSHGIPTCNFFGLIRQYYPGTAYIGNPYFYGTGVQVGFVSATGSLIAKGFGQFNAGNGYREQEPNNEYALVEIASLSNLESDTETKVNGKQVILSGNWDKSTEPFGDTITKYAPNFFTYSEGQPRTIAFAGDGTKLTSNQRSVLISAMEALKSGLAELEAE